jgi:hypothetical protein
MTYVESAGLMNDLEFRGRIKVACLKFGTYIIDEPTSIPAHSTRVRWAQNTAINPDQAAMQIQPMVVMDPQVQAEGPAISDAELQTAVESTVNRII